VVLEIILEKDNLEERDGKEISGKIITPPKSVPFYHG